MLTTIRSAFASVLVAALCAACGDGSEPSASCNAIPGTYAVAFSATKGSGCITATNETWTISVDGSNVTATRGDLPPLAGTWDTATCSARLKVASRDADPDCGELVTSHAWDVRFDADGLHGEGGVALICTASNVQCAEEFSVEGVRQ